MKFRKVKRWVNIRVTRWGFAPLFVLLAACQQCQVPPPEPGQPTATTGTATTGGPTLEQRCAEACETYRRLDCVNAETVCAADGFNEEGECTRLITCEQACLADPDLYLDGACD